ncbi:efflux transporter outer membrane subunit [Paludibacterium yongneupense]|uniref:efflux transporter outer membrane subunit n=1 Tax=Paludibacterium yongneupense TaxID=400061 RepID=UPI00040A13E0|nr:efflux transporter outer membrane subunit [Paludibacterium yongneupense]
MLTRTRFWLPLVAASLAGCAVGPDYVRPTIDVPARFKESAGWKPAAPADAIARGQWWEAYGDAGLNALEARLAASNQTIAQAEANYRQATALLEEARASYSPTVSASAAATRSSVGSGNQGTSSSALSTSYSTALTASWEPDLWGGVRRSVEAGRASQEASAATLESTRLAQQAQLALSYFQLYIADSQKRSFDDSVAAYQQQLDLTQHQFDSGVASRAAVVQAQSQLKSMQVSAVDEALTRAKLVHAIAVLLGENPSSFDLSELKQAPRVPATPTGVPSELLQRRPDIAVAERDVAQANAKIGVARSAWFPSLTLTGSGGYKSPSYANWLTLPYRVWSIGPQLAATLFDGGLRSAEDAAAVASYDASVANYRATVLAGFQDVEDNLAGLRQLEQEQILAQGALDAARESETITLNQYRAGTVSYLSVVTVQATRQSAERSLYSIVNNRLAASVGLIKALGGGWQAGDPVHPVPSAAQSEPRG